MRSFSRVENSSGMYSCEPKAYFRNMVLPLNNNEIDTCPILKSRMVRSYNAYDPDYRCSRRKSTVILRRQGGEGRHKTSR